jgi:hypothetical protein
MSYLANKDGSSLSVAIVGGNLSIIHEADNGILVVRLPRRKHWRDDEADIPVRYQLARIYTGDAAVEARRHILCNSAHCEAMPHVVEFIGEKMEAGRDWQKVRRIMVERANTY